MHAHVSLGGVALALLAVACHDVSVAPSGLISPVPDAAAPFDDEAPLDDDLVAAPPDWEAPSAEVGTGAPVLFLAFDGGHLTARDSFLVPRGGADLPPFDAQAFGVRDREAAIEWVVARVAAHFADTRLVVVRDRPDRGPFTTVHVGGHPRHIAYRGRVAGVAPFDPGNRSAADVGFAFAATVGRGRGEADLAQLASVIAHEAGHTFGLDHDLAPESLMYPTAHDGMERFLAAERVDGGWQDAPAELRRVLGEAWDDDAGEDDGDLRGGPDARVPGEGEPGRGGGDDDAEPGAADCGHDAQEPNDERSTARRLSPRGAVGRACPGDDDWFRFDLVTGSAVDLRVETGGADMPPPEVFRPRGRTPLGSAYAEPGAVGLRFVAPADGTYRARLTAETPQGYRLSMMVEDE